MGGKFYCPYALEKKMLRCSSMVLSTPSPYHTVLGESLETDGTNFFVEQMTFLSPNQQCQSTKENWQSTALHRF